MLSLAKSLTTASSSTTYSSYSKTYLVKGVLKIAFGAAVAIGVLGAGQAQAADVIINVTSCHPLLCPQGPQVTVSWIVSTFYGTYTDNIDKFKEPWNGGVMPWWGNSSLAAEFMEKTTLLGFHLAFPNPGAPPIPGDEGGPRRSRGGPYFAFEAGFLSDGWPYPIAKVYAYDSVYATWADPFLAYNYSNYSNLILPEGSFSWAQARPVPVPGPLPALGAAAAFGFSRKLRKRIKTSTNPARSDSSLCT
jgi:hypothetical protein